jgi:YD repeat-containing protein
MSRGHGANMLLAGSAIVCATSAEAAETIAYSYDSLGRLVRVEHSGSVNGGAKADYSYDSADNRTNVTVSGVPKVVGGGFEVPDVGVGYAYAPTGGPATFTDRAGIAGDGSLWGFAPAPEGNQVAFVQSYGTASTIRLTVTGLTPGTSYTARFRIAARPGYGANPVTVAFGSSALGTFTPGSTAFTAYVSAAFTASATSGELIFTGGGSAADLGTGLDFVTVAAAGSN